MPAALLPVALRCVPNQRVGLWRVGGQAAYPTGGWGVGGGLMSVLSSGPTFLL